MCVCIVCRSGAGVSAGKITHFRAVCLIRPPPSYATNRRAGIKMKLRLGDQFCLLSSAANSQQSWFKLQRICTYLFDLGAPL